MKANMLYKYLCDLMVAGENLAEIDVRVYDENNERLLPIYNHNLQNLGPLTFNFDEHLDLSVRGV